MQIPTYPSLYLLTCSCPKPSIQCNLHAQWTLSSVQPAVFNLRSTVLAFRIGLFFFSNHYHFLNSQGTMSDMDRSSSDDSVSVDSQEDANDNYKMDFSEDEEDLISRLYNLLGPRWALIAGRIPGRTAEEIEKYCSRRYCSEE